MKLYLILFLSWIIVAACTIGIRQAIGMEPVIAASLAERIVLWAFTGSIATVAFILPFAAKRRK